MRLSLLLTCAASAALLTGCTMTTPETTAEAPMTVEQPPEVELAAPIAKREPVTIEQVGRTRVDPYHWLKDDNWQEVMQDPTILRSDIRDYLVAENAFTKAKLEGPTTDLREKLFEEMRGRIKEDDSSLPDIDGPYAYLTRYRAGGEYPIIARKPAADIYNAEAPEEVLLDGDEMGKDKAYFRLVGASHSPDHKLIAYGVDDQGSEFYDIHFKDLETGEVLPFSIKSTYGAFVWGKNSDRIFWVERNDEARPSAVNMYKLGDEGSTEIYRETDPGYFVGVDEGAGDAVVERVAAQVEDAQASG